MKYYKIMMATIIIIIISMKGKTKLNVFKYGVPEEEKQPFLIQKNKSSIIFSKNQAYNSKSKQQVFQLC